MSSFQPSHLSAVTSCVIGDAHAFSLVPAFVQFHHSYWLLPPLIPIPSFDPLALFSYQIRRGHLFRISPLVRDGNPAAFSVCF